MVAQSVWLKRRSLALKLGLTLLVDISRRPATFKPQYIVQDTMPKDHVKLLPKGGHWKVMR